MSLYFKKFLSVLLFLVLMICFQNCDTGFNGSTLDLQSLKIDGLPVEPIDPIVDPSPLPTDPSVSSFIVERKYKGTTSYSPYELRVVKITGSIDSPASPLYGSESINDKWIISKEEKNQKGEECHYVYSVDRDDIRNLLSSIESMGVLDAQEEFKDVSFPAVMPSYDAHAIKVNDSKNDVFLGFTPWVSQLFTEDLSLKDFTKTLAEYDNKIISSHCQK